MKNFRITLLALVASLFLVQSCGPKKETNTENEQATEATADQTKVEESTEEVTTVAAATVSKEQLEGMLSGYFNIKNALVETDAKEAKSAAEKMLNSLGEEMTSLKSLLTEMTATEDVEGIRKDFETLSTSMYAVVKENADKKEATVYKQYCPMAFNNEGAYWLSSENEVRNPYFGDKMLKCGKVEEEL